MPSTASVCRAVSSRNASSAAGSCRASRASPRSFALCGQQRGQLGLGPGRPGHPHPPASISCGSRPSARRTPAPPAPAAAQPPQLESTSWSDACCAASSTSPASAPASSRNRPAAPAPAPRSSPSRPGRIRAAAPRAGSRPTLATDSAPASESDPGGSSASRAATNSCRSPRQTRHPSQLQPHRDHARRPSRGGHLRPPRRPDRRVRRQGRKLRRTPNALAAPARPAPSPGSTPARDDPARWRPTALASPTPQPRPRCSSQARPATPRRPSPAAPSPTTCANRATSSRDERRASSSTRPAVTRRSRNQPSTNAKCCVPNSFSSSFSRSPVSAHRNRANSPCGSSTTWKNWSLLIPSSRSTVSPDVVDPRQPVRRVPARRRAHPGQRRLRVLLRRPAAALLGSLVLGAAHHPQPMPADGQLEPHLGDARPARRSRTAAASPGPHSRHGAEQRERHRVEQRRLARAGVAVQQEQPVRAEPVEVDDLTRRVRPERVSSRRCSLMRQLSTLLASSAFSSLATAQSLTKQRLLALARRDPRQSSTKSHATSWSVPTPRRRRVPHRRRHRARRPPVEVHRVREPLLQAPQRIRRPDPVGELHGEVLVDQPIVCRFAQQAGKRPADRREGTRHRQLRRSTPASPSRPARPATPTCGAAPRRTSRRAGCPSTAGAPPAAAARAGDPVPRSPRRRTPRSAPARHRRPRSSAPTRSARRR